MISLMCSSELGTCMLQAVTYAMDTRDRFRGPGASSEGIVVYQIPNHGPGGAVIAVCGGAELQGEGRGFLNEVSRKQ